MPPLNKFTFHNEIDYSEITIRTYGDKRVALNKLNQLVKQPEQWKAQ